MSDYKTLKTLIQEAGILELKKPDDYPMVMRVDRYAVEKPTAQLVIKAHWLEPKNPDKPNVVYLGHQIFDTYWYNGKTFPTVAHAMIFKWNSIVNRTWKCDLYDNRDFPGRKANPISWDGTKLMVCPTYMEFMKIIHRNQLLINEAALRAAKKEHGKV